MKRIAYPAVVLAAGMAATHLLFTFLVHRSDLALYSKIVALKTAGYVVVPNDLVLPALTQLWPAFCGALFFTLTVGAGLSLMAFIGAWTYRRLFGNRIFSAILAIVWVGLIISVNAAGWNPGPTTVFLVVPPLVFFLAQRLMPQQRNLGDGYAWIAHAAVIAIVALAWIPRLDGNVFINVRDYLLLENQTGKAVNTFYYQYTLYPAELFKTLDQKLLKTACVNVADPDNLKGIGNRLAVYDFLPLQGNVPCDLQVTQEGSQLVFSNGRGTEVRTDLAEFLSGSKTGMEDFSRKTDKNGLFRIFTFGSLVVAFPLALYVFAHALFGVLLLPVPPVFLRSVLASLVCMGIGIGAVIPLYGGVAEKIGNNEIRDKVSAADWRGQRDGLKAMADQGIDPMRMNIDPMLVQSRHVAVRYWMARALAGSRSPEAYRMLIRLINDPHPNVACMAYYGLGHSGFPRTASDILGRINGIPHWYVQWYAYKSLKKLGWVQNQSNTTSGQQPL